MQRSPWPGESVLPEGKLRGSEPAPHYAAVLEPGTGPSTAAHPPWTWRCGKDSRSWIRRHREQIASAQTTRSQKAQHSTTTPHNVQVGGGRASSVDVIGCL